jgi:hypothetical protein
MTHFTTRLTFLLVLSTVALPGLAEAGQKQPQEKEHGKQPQDKEPGHHKKDYRELAFEELTRAKKELDRVTALAAEKAASKHELQTATLAYLKAKYRWGEADWHPQPLLIQTLEGVVKIQTEQLNALKEQTKNGAALPETVDRARKGLAETTILMQFHVLVDVREREVRRLEDLADAKGFDLQRLEAARQELVLARKQLAAWQR